MNYNGIFWQELNKIVYDITNHGSLNSYFNKLTIKRNDDFSLIYILEGEKEWNMPLPHLGGIAGTHVSTITNIEAENQQLNIKIILEQPLPQSMNIKGNYIKLEGKVNKATIKYNSINEEAKYICYYFLNGSDKLFYIRPMIIRSDNHKSIEVNDFLKEEYYAPSETPLWSSISNSIGFTINNKRFILSYFDEKFTNSIPKSMLWFNYKDKPEQEEVNTIIYLFNFLFGTKLIPIGHSIFANNFIPLEECFYNNYTTELKKWIIKSEFPPIPINRYDVDLEQIVSKLLDKYYLMRDDFQLDKIMDYINISLLLPLDIMVQPLSAVLDMIQNIWFDKTENIPKTLYLEKNNFKNLISKYEQSITDELLKYINTEDTKIIINKLNDLNRISLNQRNILFFKEIGIELGDVEEKTLRYRNKAVHGTIEPIEDIDFQKNADYNRSFYTLICKVVLKLLDYNGSYVDYSTYGNPNFPNRHINEKLGGPLGNGNI